MSMLIFNDEMYSFLQFAQRESIIAALFLQGDSSHINDEGNYVKRVDDEIDVVSFLPKSKYEKVEDNWENGRVKIKIGRFIRKFLTDFSIQNFNINDQMIEKFVNLYKSYFSRDISKLKIVEGEEILKYYLEDNKNIKYAKTNASLIVQLSIKESIMLLGYENQFYNLYHINANYEKDYPFLINTIDKNNSKYTDTVKDILLTIIRNRMNNLKQIIIRTQSILYNIQNNGKISSIYNNYEKEIIKEFTKKIKKIAITDASLHNKIFKHNTYIINNVFVDYNIPNIELKINKNYIDVNNISILNNSDCKLIFYLIYNLNKLLEYNTKTTIITDLAYLIIKIIRYLFNIYYKPYSNYNVRKFDFLLINEIPYINENLKTVGNYQELLTQEEIDDPDAKEQMYTQLEAFDSLDIDDYEPNEDFDIDNSFEALDGYE
mgnify:CR=1 FL=1